MVATQSGKSGRTGRPRQFDRDLALKTAMHLFWRNGYEGTSVNDLTTAIGIAPPSLYAAFGDKASLYKEALDRYASLPNAANVVLLGAAGDLDAAVLKFLTRVVDLMTSPGRERGCMVASASISSHPQHAEVAADLRLRRAGFHADILAALYGRLPPKRAAVAASCLVALLQGLSIQARDGATRKELMEVVRGCRGAAAWKA